MAGLRMMCLGPYQFEAIGFGFDGRSKSQRTSWATVPVAGGMDRTQWTGGDSSTQTISGAVFREFGGQGALEGIKFAARQGIPLPFVDLSGGLSNVFGMHVVEEVSEDAGVFDAGGAALKNAYEIKLREYQGSFDGMGLLSVVSLFL